MISEQLSHEWFMVFSKQKSVLFKLMITCEGRCFFYNAFQKLLQDYFNLLIKTLILYNVYYPNDCIFSTFCVDFQRYYGKSLPFGDDSFSTQNIGYLTIEQALADYSYLVQYLKDKFNATDAPVIAFGGR